MVRVAVVPEDIRPFLVDAVIAGGGVISHPAEAEALVWTSHDDAAGLRTLLHDHPQIRWVQLPWAGIEGFVDVLDCDRLWTAGQGVYAEPVAEHALALTLAGLRDLKRRAAATSWQQASGVSLMGARVTIFGAGGIARALASLLAPFRVHLTIVRRRAPATSHEAASAALDAVRPLPVAARGHDVRDADVLDAARTMPSAARIEAVRDANVDTDVLDAARTRPLAARSHADVLNAARIEAVGNADVDTDVARTLRLAARSHAERHVDVDTDVIDAARTLPLAARIEAVRDADVVVLACALTPATRRCIAAAELAAMKRTAWLVNVARGALIDTDALVAALREQRIGGAALDVTEPEPLPEGHALWSLERCWITPHVANTPEMAVPLLSERVRENVRRFAAGEPMLGTIDVGAGY